MDEYQTYGFWNMKHSELKQLIKEEIQKVLNEETEDISLLAKTLYKGGADSQNKTKTAIEAKLGRKLTSIEQAKVTKVVNKIDNEKFVASYEKRKKETSAELKKRSQQRLLPLELDNFRGTPDPRYYEAKKTLSYTDTDRAIDILEPSGITKFKLKDKYINTPVTGSIKVGKEDWTLEKIYKEFYGF